MVSCIRPKWSINNDQSLNAFENYKRARRGQMCSLRAFCFPLLRLCRPRCRKGFALPGKSPFKVSRGDASTTEAEPLQVIRSTGKPEAFRTSGGKAASAHATGCG
jgi:hypothetical protein